MTKAQRNERLGNINFLQLTADDALFYRARIDDDFDSTEDGNASAGGKFDDTFFAEIKLRREALLKKEGEHGEK